jgi:hypothetical protein
VTGALTPASRSRTGLAFPFPSGWDSQRWERVSKLIGTTVITWRRGVPALEGPEGSRGDLLFT